LGLIAGLALAMSLAAAESTLPVRPTTPVIGDQAAFEQVPPAPAPVLFLAGGLLGVAALVRWRRHLRR
jgi:hypothetical protein